MDFEDVDLVKIGSRFRVLTFAWDVFWDVPGNLACQSTCESICLVRTGQTRKLTMHRRRLDRTQASARVLLHVTPSETESSWASSRRRPISSLRALRVMSLGKSIVSHTFSSPSRITSPMVIV